LTRHDATLRNANPANPCRRRGSSFRSRSSRHRVIAVPRLASPDLGITRALGCQRPSDVTVIPVPIFSALSARRRAPRHAEESKVSLVISSRLVGKLTRSKCTIGDVKRRAESTAVRRPLTRDRGSREDRWLLTEKFECFNALSTLVDARPRSDISSKRSTIESSALCSPSRIRPLRLRATFADLCAIAGDCTELEESLERYRHRCRAKLPEAVDSPRICRSSYPVVGRALNNRILCTTIDRSEFPSELS